MSSSFTSRSRSWLTAALLLTVAAPIWADADPDAAFADCLHGLHTQAHSHGLSPATLEQSFASIEYRPRIVELDRSQPEFVQTFWDYFQARADQRRTDRGRTLLVEHDPLLSRIHADYGVRPEYLLAFWGLETNFGSYFGSTPVLDALATLACEGRRGSFFSEQLMHALRIIDEDGIEPQRMVGSWAGAMGHTQFMPSTFTAYAVDYDGTGQRDLWDSLPDAMASAANYLQAMGWRDGERWGREVSLPRDFDYALSGLDIRKSLSEWRRHGVRAGDGGELPSADLEASLLLPAGYSGPAFLVYDNFHVILRWNRSTHYALAVGHLADRIAGMGQLYAEAPDHIRPLSRKEVKEIQQRLVQLGHLDGAVDGIAGRQTRAALRDFQQQQSLPADGYPDHRILEALR